MRAAIYNPYLDTLGGGERYSMAAAQALVKDGYRVDVEWKDSGMKQRLEKRFGIDLGNTRFVEDVKRGDGYDVCFWVSDGSIPILRARKNLLHFQVPFKDINGKTLLNKMKLFRINEIICNSYFTKSFIDKEYGVESIVIYPPVDVGKIKPKRKENLILSVGRFSQLAQAKRQDVLVEAFKKFYDSGFNDWRLVLSGGSEVGVGKFVENLRETTADYPVKILESPSFIQIRELYGKAKIFWSATGFGVGEEKNPEKVEHFGITVVEAMAAGAVPIVVASGGHKETIKEGKNGFLWKTTGKLLNLTRKVVEDKKLWRDLSKNAKWASRKYSYERFEKKFLALL